MVAVETCAIPPFRVLTKRVLLHSDNGVNGALYEWRVIRRKPNIGKRYATGRYPA